MTMCNIETDAEFYRRLWLEAIKENKSLKEYKNTLESRLYSLYELGQRRADDIFVRDGKKWLDKYMKTKESR